MLVKLDEFSAALSRVKPALNAGAKIAELSHVWFTEDCIYAYDGGFGIELAYPTELNCGVPGIPFLELLGTTALKEAKLELKGTALQVSLGKSHSKLAALEADRRIWGFPGKPAKGKPLALGEDFVEALRRTLMVKARVATRVEHHGVTLQPDKKASKLYLYSTDSATIAEAVVDVATTSFERVILPLDFATQIVLQSPQGIDLYVLPDCIIAQGTGITFYSNLLDTSGSDDMGAIIARQADKHTDPQPLPAGLVAALSRAEILAGREEPNISVSVEKGALVITGEYAMGSLNETLKLEGKPPEAKLRIKAELLKRALPYAEGFSVTNDSMLLLGEPGFTYVIAGL